MDQFQDANVADLFNIVRDNNEPMINDDQRIAVEILGGLTRKGNGEAAKALKRLAESPFIHPLLRENIRQYVA